MEFLEKIKRLGEKAQAQKDVLQTEEASKNALVMPFLIAMGYDVFDPHQVVPEYVADVGMKKNEKVDYLLMAGDKPRIIIECKKADANLVEDNKHQLKRYFSVLSDIQFAILTNGILYEIYSDIDTDNIMDDDPFLVVNLLQLDESAVESLKIFTRSQFKADDALSQATRLKYRAQIKEELASLYEEPSTDFVKLCIRQVHRGTKTQNIVNKFTPIVRDAFRQFINDEVGSRLKYVFEGKNQPEAQAESQEEKNEKNAAEEQTGSGRIITTEEEIAAFELVRELISEQISPDRIAIRDRISYCGILLDDNRLKPICRLQLDGKKKSIQICTAMDGEKKGEKVFERFPVEQLEDIRQYKSQLLAACDLYEKTEEIAAANVLSLPRASG